MTLNFAEFIIRQQAITETPHYILEHFLSFIFKAFLAVTPIQ